MRSLEESGAQYDIVTFMLNIGLERVAQAPVNTHIGGKVPRY